MQYAGIYVASIALMGMACPAGPVESQLTRDQAIEIAQRDVSFEPESVEAELSTSDGRTVWQVTFRGRLPGQPPGLFETMIIEVDAATGEIVSIART